jgi:imidazoleglycerol phosphate synthase glutamine amidotransferase subunit HisH
MALACISTLLPCVQTPSAMPSQPCVGVLAIQGSFREHIAALKRCGAQAMEVRTACDLDACDGLVIPGGESTTMAHVAEKTGLLTHLREFVTQKRPVWGTCAGLIFLAESAEGAAMWHCRVSIPGTCWHALQELNSTRAVRLPRYVHLCAWRKAAHI